MRPFAISRLHWWLFKIRFRVWKWKQELILTKWIARKWSLICNPTLIYAWRLGGLKLFKCWWNYIRSFNGRNHWCRRETLRFAKYFFCQTCSWSAGMYVFLVLYIPFLKRCLRIQKKPNITVLVLFCAHNEKIAVLFTVKACLHRVGDPGLVGLVSFVSTLWGTQNKRNLPH